MINRKYTLKRAIRQTRYLQIGDKELTIKNSDNREIIISCLNFRLLADGTIKMELDGSTKLYSLDELKETVRKYKLAYQEMKDLEKKLKLQGDF